MLNFMPSSRYVPSASSRRISGWVGVSPAGIAPLPDAQCRQMAAMLRRAELAGESGAAMVATGRAALSVLTDPVSVRAPVSLADAASAAALSPGRFRHLFVQETGTPFRAWLLWLRLNVAIEAAMAGASWTEAAHEAGFADSAHPTRTFKRMFGINPVDLTAARERAA